MAEQKSSAILSKGGAPVKHLLECMMQVQNLVTVILTLAFLHLSMTGRIAADQFLTIFSVVIAFYFGSQRPKDPTVSK